ncbi:hypothetical protein [Microbacterium testaceum]|uniref:hypothetical protein n=1 Tax=Microbacterium testaceum TaxID=2033 RepID=UPI002AC38F45|nr:hypothetical protein [Microbacterium testaceum]MDZ5146306.1 hypothetical protein [Microbacterium testaceum]
MSLASPRKHAEIPEELLRRLRRALLVAVTIVLAVAAGWLGTLLAPHIGKIVLAALAVVLLWALVTSVIAFFRG